LFRPIPEELQVPSVKPDQLNGQEKAIPSRECEESGVKKKEEGNFNFL
jgi:hypothetical protein